MNRPIRTALQTLPVLASGYVILHVDRGWIPLAALIPAVFLWSIWARVGGTAGDLTRPWIWALAAAAWRWAPLHQEPWLWLVLYAIFAVHWSYRVHVWLPSNPHEEETETEEEDTAEHDPKPRVVARDLTQPQAPLPPLEAHERVRYLSLHDPYEGVSMEAPEDAPEPVHYASALERVAAVWPTDRRSLDTAGAVHMSDLATLCEMDAKRLETELVDAGVQVSRRVSARPVGGGGSTGKKGVTWAAVQSALATPVATTQEGPDLGG